MPPCPPSARNRRVTRCAELDRLSAATLGDAGLRQRLRDAQALALERVGRDHIHFAETGDARRDRGEVVHVATEADIGKDLPAERLERIAEHLRVADSSISILI